MIVHVLGHGHRGLSGGRHRARNPAVSGAPSQTLTSPATAPTPARPPPGPALPSDRATGSTSAISHDRACVSHASRTHGVHRSPRSTWTAITPSRVLTGQGLTGHKG